MMFQFKITAIIMAIFIAKSISTVSGQDDNIKITSDLGVAESAGFGTGSRDTVLDKSALKKGGAARFKIGLADAYGFKVAKGAKKGFSKKGEKGATGMKIKAEKKGLAGLAKHGAKFEKKAGKLVTFASGRKKAAGAVKTFGHDSAFKFGKALSYGSSKGDAKGLMAKKYLKGEAKLDEFKAGAKAKARGFAADGAGKIAGKTGIGEAVGLKKGIASADKATILGGRGGYGGIAG